MLSVLGELVVDLIPVPGPDAGPGGDGAQLRRPPRWERPERGRGRRPPGHAGRG